MSDLCGEERKKETNKPGAPDHMQTAEPVLQHYYSPSNTLLKNSLTLKFPSQTLSLLADDVLQIYEILWKWTIKVICQQVIQ
jgi:hypothetical protein